jgi:Mrp family chromosome partitioning ATPase
MTEKECTHDCSSCQENCPSHGGTIPKEKPNDGSHVRKMIAVVSGKGGVGKSLVTSLLALLTQRSGKQAAVLDADITGPSIPRIFGCRDEVFGNEMGMIPPVAKAGVKLMSINLLLHEETEPVVWRGSVISGAVKQFWTDVCWGDVDCLYVDMPPGTGDVPLTVFQSLPVDGIVIVTSPQELVSMIVEKAVHMANKMQIPILGIVENYSYYECPDCGKRHSIYGESHVDAVAEKYHIPVLAKLPLDPDLAALCDRGELEALSPKQADYLSAALQKLLPNQEL